ncbi:hypothetical protein SAMN05216410_0894 [Sanguibacter gelidistatuariae]|uniref:Uncharacterized protein n=1 Tax=Sanguibacter gelidistatuariae TaxID=1814289 RepID=A0A1G6HDQ4_9MICO|nr:hypothetical protein [Sanguibacter gelidistatuariae]SDB91556.1 hypothetical protein SAMN05216410_0894 [Sanguibacter gelidistatuariae]
MPTVPDALELTPLPSVSALPIADLYARHLLGVSDDVEPSEVETLALARFAAAAWEVPPVEERTATGGRLLPGMLRISRHILLSGPYAPLDEHGSSLGFTPDVEMVYDVVCPRERGAAPHPGGDQDGLGRVFADALPVRGEWRVASWLVAVGRRLGGSLFFEVTPGVRSMMSPDPAVSVDLTVYSDVWLDPAAAERVCQDAHAGARLASSGEPWGGPPPSTGLVPAIENSDLTPDQLYALHARADAFDIEALSTPQTLSSYGVQVDLGKDGIVSVEVGGIEKPPVVLRGLDWAEHGAVTYEVRWTPVDLVDWQREIPSFDHRLARTRATGVVAQLARAIFAAVGGEVADQDDFLVDPEDV